MQADGEPPEALAPDRAVFPSEVVAELRALRALMEQHMPGAGEKRPATDVPSQEMRKLKIELDVIGNAIKQTRSEIVSLQDQGFDSSRVARVTQELDAVFDDTSGATDRILKAAEEIDQHAQALMSVLKGGHEQGLAQDIQDRVTAIFEACNFHDLTGQRISKVAGTLKMVEEHLARMMEIWSVIERFNVEAAQSAAGSLDGLINGPKLDGDNGHSSQDEIDKLFH
jgi:chemotaxis protein CheZ